MTTFAKGRRVRHLPLPRHEHIKPIAAAVTDDVDAQAELVSFVEAIARMHARQHHAAEFGDGNRDD